ncbi:MAG: right-handed parallel beta-helix repeat-containing protein [Deinococcota bacterium]
MRMFFNGKTLLALVISIMPIGFSQTVIPPAAPPAAVITAISTAPEGATIIFNAPTYGPFAATINIGPPDTIATRLTFVSSVNSTTLIGGGPGPVLSVNPGANFSCMGIDFQYNNGGPSRNTHVAVVGGAGLVPTNVSIDNCSFSGGIRNPLAAQPAGDGLVLTGDVTGTIVNSRFTNNGGNGITVGPNALLPANPTRPNIMRNIISNNGGAGVFIATPATPLLEDNKIDSNRGSGVFYTGIQGGRAPNNGGLARNNIVDTNNVNGFTITNSASPIIDSNAVFNNGSDGFNVRNSASPRVENNEVRGNTRAAFELGIASAGTFDNNLCQGNLGTQIGGPAVGDSFFQQRSSTAIIGATTANTGCLPR